MGERERLEREREVRGGVAREREGGRERRESERERERFLKRSGR